MKDQEFVHVAGELDPVPVTACACIGICGGFGCMSERGMQYMRELGYETWHAFEEKEQDENPDGPSRA